MENVKLDLIEPLIFGTETVTSLSFKPMKAKHLRGLTAKAGFGEMLDLAGKLCGLTTDEMGELGAQDAMKVIEVVGGFLGNGQKTGEESTQS